MGFQKLEALPLWQAAVYENGLPVNKGTAPIWGNRRGETYQPPKIGKRVRVTMNNLGPAIVMGYAVQDGYLGLLVKLETPPEWHVKQNAGRTGDSLVFGPEIAPL